MIGLVLVLGITLGLSLAPRAAEAQTAGKIPRIGVLSSTPSDMEGFRQGLRERGYTEDRTILIE